MCYGRKLCSCICSAHLYMKTQICISWCEQRIQFHKGSLRRPIFFSPPTQLFPRGHRRPKCPFIIPPQPLTPRKTATGFNKERPNLRNSLKGQPAQWRQNLDVMQSHDVSAGAKLLGLLLYKTVAMSGVVCLIIASKCSLPWGGGLGRCSDTHVCLGCLWIPSTRWVWNVASHFCP